MNMSKQLQDKINQFQGLQNQLQSLIMQKQQMTLQSADIENALKALEGVDKQKIYTAVGPLFIESEKEETEKKLKEQKEILETRIQMFDKQEKKLTEKLKNLNLELQAELQSGAIQGG